MAFSEAQAGRTVIDLVSRFSAYSDLQPARRR